MGILRFFTRHGTAANLLLMGILAFGLYAATQIRTQYMPDVVIESISVSVEWDDAAPEDIDKSIIAVASPPLLAVEGVTELSAVAREGRARIMLEFEPGWNLDRALNDVEAAMPGAASLPEGAETPEISRSAWRDQVLDVVLSGDLDRSQMERLGEQLESALQRAGVTRASLRGLTAPRIALIADPAALAEYGLTLSDLASAVGTEAQQTASGQLDNSAARLRAGTDRRDADAIRGIEIETATGPVPIDQLARIVVDSAGSGRAYYLEGRPAVSIGVERGVGGDALKLQSSVKAVADSFLATAPEGLKIDLIRNRAAEIGDRLALLIDNGVFGLLLVLGLLYLFLSPSAAIWVAAGIPVSVAAGIGLMWISGQSLNMISLFALILCLGIIVDDAIVIAEHTEHRNRTLGEPRARAAERAAIRMLGPVLASTVTTVVAFLSLEFVGGRFGAFIATIPLVVAAVLLASLAECFLVLPHHMAHGLNRLDASWVGAPARLVTRGFDWMRLRAFAPLLRLVIRLRYAVVLLALAALFQSILMVTDRDVAWRFFSAPSTPTISANIAMRDGSSRSDTVAMLEELNRAAGVVRTQLKTQYGTDPVVFILSEIGGSSGPGLATSDDKDADLIAAITMELVDEDRRPYGTDVFIQALEAELKRPDALETFSFRGGRFGPGGDSLDVVFYGQDLERLKAASLALQDAMAQVPEVTGVEDNLTFSGFDHALTLNGYGRALGFSAASLASELRARISGITALSYLDGSRDATIEVELPEGSITAAYLDEIRLEAPTGEWVRLGEVVDVGATPAVTSLRREAGLNLIRVTGSVADEDATRAEDIMTEVQEVTLPRIAQTYGVSYRLDGLAAQEADFLGQAAIGYGICLLGIYMTLALVLGSWTQPLTIMAVVPFGVTGVIWGHYAQGLPMSIFSIVGLIGMSGIIVNDSIVLVSAFGEKLPRRATIPAVIEATSERLRPVLLTTLTTVLGLAPLLFERSSQAEFLKPMVVTLCYGLGVGFFVVLLIVPSLVVIQHDLARALTTTRRMVRYRRVRRARRTP
ncbi:efflux RND transporter permease subunit [Pseudooceanicola sediminis]|uniref:Efflux RND transporter permease subunit n=1 Tax=Pseudooceanicola sediminis TaxID=2211117 RepID=A0A399J382_9RHOB|nr:efflux RND transporter permease subunit [Pseudooceanicola sediminis]KAA2314261.1 efflux RND transporter permease subunit [Puniceibacterium sp. HSS470]RII39883.1 efflux RND transporter permease subunit [Pseudooceanicola sediminis]|tara:strand:- start:17894 stop:21034 length:3141 start_codon:yes stop_codon:yes gene_type:complete